MSVPAVAVSAVDVVVIGGGISGLAAAHRLRARLGPDARITLVEQADRLGGKLRTVELAGTATDVGAEAFVLRNPAAVELVRELGLGDRLIHPRGASATVRAGGRTVPLPKRTFLGVPADPELVRPVLSAAAGERAAAEPTLPPLEIDDDVPVARVLTERFGPELVDNLVEPLLGGVYAGRADRLGLRATMPALVDALGPAGGSLTAAAARVLGTPASDRPVFGGLRGGMTVLVDELRRQARAEVRLGLPVRELRRGAVGWELEIGSPGGVEVLHADAVVLAVPPPAARRLLTGAVPAAAAAYAGIEVGSMAVLSMVLPIGVGLPDTSGVLLAVGQEHADGTPFTAKAFTHTSVKWGGDPVRLRASIGRFGETGLLRRDDADLLAAVRADLRELTGVAAAPVDWTVTRWGGGLPQYGVGHTAAVSAIERSVAEVPGLAVAGAALRGVGIPACVDGARAAADRVAGYLRAATEAR
ncbi:MAG: protoporphyrinogen oxidase [Actinophytocola sp.]|uniref:protoporphyrinogen oxidase n=1 Tax=Actinophytocola sp. TaxID=1872138 RepID=UPI003D6C5682